MRYYSRLISLNGSASMPLPSQGLFIFYVIAINVILSAVGIGSRQPHAWYASGLREEMTSYVANRAGVLSFANLILWPPEQRSPLADQLVACHLSPPALLGSPSLRHASHPTLCSLATSPRGVL
jgi:hypothetical protein